MKMIESDGIAYHNNSSDGKGQQFGNLANGKGQQLEPHEGPDMLRAARTKCQAYKAHEVQETPDIRGMQRPPQLVQTQRRAQPLKCLKRTTSNVCAQRAKQSTEGFVHAHQKAHVSRNRIAL